MWFSAQNGQHNGGLYGMPLQVQGFIITMIVY